MATHQERAKRIYGSTATPARAVPVPTSQETAAARIYGGSDHGAALASYFDRREASLRDDAEGLEITRRERQQVAEFARKRGISGQDLLSTLMVVQEHDSRPKSPEVYQQRWNQAMETLRLECGGMEPAKRLVDNFVRVATELAQEVPTLADRAGRTGAANDVRVIRALAHYGAEPTSTEEK